MDVISPTRFIRVHPSSMNMVIIWTTIVLIIPEQNNNYWNKSWRLGFIPTRNTITLYLFSMRIIPYSFASYLGRMKALALRCYVWHFIPTNPVSNTEEPHSLTSSEYTHDMYIIYIHDQLDTSSLLFSAKIFSDPLLAFPFLFRRIYQYQWWHHSHDTWSKAC